MAFEFKRLADVEALSEVPENATVLAEVNGSIKRIPSVGLGGASGSTIVIVKNPNYTLPSPMSIDPDSSDEFLVNMNFVDAMDAFRAYEITGAVVYLPMPSELEVDTSASINMMIDYALVADGTSQFGLDCLMISTLNSNDYIYWTADGLSTFSPSGGPV